MAYLTHLEPVGSPLKLQSFRETKLVLTESQPLSIQPSSGITTDLRELAGIFWGGAEWFYVVGVLYGVDMYIGDPCHDHYHYHFRYHYHRTITTAAATTSKRQHDHYYYRYQCTTTTTVPTLPLPDYQAGTCFHVAGFVMDCSPLRYTQTADQPMMDSVGQQEQILIEPRFRKHLLYKIKFKNGYKEYETVSAVFLSSGRAVGLAFPPEPFHGGV